MDASGATWAREKHIAQGGIYGNNEIYLILFMTPETNKQTPRAHALTWGCVCVRWMANLNRTLETIYDRGVSARLFVCVCVLVIEVLCRCRPGDGDGIEIFNDIIIKQFALSPSAMASLCGSSGMNADGARTIIIMSMTTTNWTCLMVVDRWADASWNWACCAIAWVPIIWCTTIERPNPTQSHASVLNFDCRRLIIR